MNDEKDTMANRLSDVDRVTGPRRIQKNGAQNKGIRRQVQHAKDMEAQARNLLTPGHKRKACRTSPHRVWNAVQLAWDCSGVT